MERTFQIKENKILWANKIVSKERKLSSMDAPCNVGRVMAGDPARNV